MMRKVTPITIVSIPCSRKLEDRRYACPFFALRDPLRIDAANSLPGTKGSN